MGEERGARGAKRGSWGAGVEPEGGGGGLQLVHLVQLVRRPELIEVVVLSQNGLSIS